LRTEKKRLKEEHSLLAKPYAFNSEAKNLSRQIDSRSLQEREETSHSLVTPTRYKVEDPEILRLQAIEKRSEPATSYSQTSQVHKGRILSFDQTKGSLRQEQLTRQESAKSINLPEI
jgi:hypothetical protein